MGPNAPQNAAPHRNHTVESFTLFLNYPPNGPQKPTLEIFGIWGF